MTDMTVAAFCKKFDACAYVKEWAYSLTAKRSEAKMSELWEAFKINPQADKIEYFQWALSCNDVFSDSILRKMACQFVRETPLADGLATQEVLDAARDAAWAADGDARDAQIKIMLEYGNPWLEG